MRNPRLAKRAAAVALASIFVLCFLPISALAKEPRGATVVVTKTDGSQIEGELLAVKPDSLLLLGFGNKDGTIDLAAIRSVRIKRKAHSGTLALGGLAAGAAAGVLISRQWRDADMNFPPVVTGAAVGAMGALAGLVLSIPFGLDTTVHLAGEPEEIVRSRLAGLARYSRESRLGAVPGPAGPEAREAPPGTPAVTSGPSPSPSRPPRGPRVRITFSATQPLSLRLASRPLDDAVFRFPGDLPPTEAGPHIASDNCPRVSYNHRLETGPYALAYELSQRWVVDVELFPRASWASKSQFGVFRFTTADTGLTYSRSYWIHRSATFDSMLIGLAYRLIAPTPLDRHAFEIGAAVGPALAKSTPHLDYIAYSPADRKVTLSARVQASYDFYFVPNLSLGACAGFRYFGANFPEKTVSADLEFWDEADPYGSPVITRLTEVTIPGSSYNGSAAFLALRLGLRI